MKLKHLGITIFLLILCATQVRAEDFDKYDFTLRFPAAQNRISTYPDVAGFGGASAGSPFSSSINPAATAWEEVPKDNSVVASPIYQNIQFDSGADFYIGVMSFVVETENYGTFIPIFIDADSNKSTARNGLDFDFAAIGGNLQWGKKLDDTKAIGINLNILQSDTDFSFGPAFVSLTDTETYGIRFGGMYQPNEKSPILGISFEYAYAATRSTTYDVFGMGFGTLIDKDPTEQFLARPGLSYEYMEDSRFYLDYQYGQFFNSTDTLRTHRIFTGIEHKVYKFIYLRAGATFDARDNISPTYGIGAYPTDRLAIEFAYQDDMFPELRPEFGRSELWTGSISLTF